MSEDFSNKTAKFRIKVSAVRQETITLTAASADEAFDKAAVQLKRQVLDENSSLEHYVICSVEEE